MTAAPATATPPTITQRLVDLARTRGDHAALLDAGAAGGHAQPAVTYAGLAATLQRAAAGLAWHGLRPGDVVGVFVSDAVSFALAVHAIRAAGGIASPVPPDTVAARIAPQLADCGARMLLTGPGLAATALEAADRSWVRQVISFGEVPGTIAFDSLLQRGVAAPAGSGPQDLALLPYARATGTPAGNGRPVPVAFTNADLAAELDRLGEARLTEHDVVVAVPPAGDGRAYTVLIDLALIVGATVVAAGPPGVAETARTHGGTTVIVPWGTSLPTGLALRTLVVTAPEDDSRTEC